MLLRNVIVPACSLIVYQGVSRNICLGTSSRSTRCFQSGFRTVMSSCSYNTVDICSYLDSVEMEVRSRGPVEVVVTDQSRNTMIRTILGYESKTEFDKTVREQTWEQQNEKLARFFTTFVSPIVLADESLLAKLPNYENNLEQAMSSKPSVKGACYLFGIIASGKRYRGDITRMLHDVAPDLIETYQDAISGPIKETVLSALIDDSNVSKERIDSARKCLEINLYQGILDKAPRNLGSATEMRCIDFLKTDFNETNTVLRNVNVKQAPNGRKMKPVRNDFWKNNPETGIIVTSIGDRNGVCSEFDAIVVQQSPGTNGTTAQVTEVWESKATLSPTTILDSLAKKLPSLRCLMKDENTILLYAEGGNTATFRAHTQPLRFGIFGIELQSIEKSATQLFSIGCREKLVGDISIAMRAVETGVVLVDSERIISKLAKLRAFYHENNEFDIRVVTV